MPEEPGVAEGPRTFTRPGGRKGLLAFYVGTGVVFLLFAGSYFAWTPVWVRYYEWQIVRERDARYSSHLLMQHMREREAAATALVDIGQPAGPAVERLLLGDQGVWVHNAVCKSHAAWTLPLLIRVARNGEMGSASAAITTAGLLAGRDFTIRRRMSGKDELKERSARLFAWWEREGKAKYGRSK
jgi:hypothetical protein